MSEYLLSLCLVACGACIQSSVGFGFSLVVVPGFAVIQPTSLPSVPLLLVLPLVAVIALSERRSIDYSGVWLILGGRILGSFVGLMILVLIPRSRLSIAFGLMILSAVAMSAVGAVVRVTPGSRLFVGVLSGTFGTAVGIGGPPMALLYQKRKGAQIRGTLAFVFLFGIAISLIVLGLGGQVDVLQVRAAVGFLPGVVGGFVLGRILTQFLSRQRMRMAVLGFAGISGVVAVVTGLSIG